ncbi:NADP-dependent phosphogluconate dehydrogenase [Hoeflea prorocentri]|uniref:6-phosphogluconate dehydrogenase, decarboxylating n=1 Tax=Hoeflea prorocentri TaxID=1922333 RepID=A0A9X3UJS7_9HYPH|nr:NADP-dependent phosphogluconate dehydrogenase [Hoeflea prorocentri]MCY6382105.1 NADP-dependent phosphogluconate dehydrogenase [Hoeflea prorocentri]MDA5399905.1 NADP-dependent phosphogluconate dehydrogenase [Hoeflea prorocentri]
MTTPGIGLIGLGTMGSNLALNIADNGHDIAVYNRTPERTRAFVDGAGELADKLTPCETLTEFVAAIAPPRNIILMVPAGEVVDQHIEILRPMLGDGDLIIDAGNANFRDTNRRAAEAREKGELFLGIGVSGGSEGARYGPSIMGGGPKPAWDRVAPVLKAIAAKYDRVPCATWMGEGGAGHFVKMVHNGIEYADMQMIAEVYGIMRDGLGYEPARIADIFAAWNKGPLHSYLIEISAEVSRAIDPQTDRPVLDIILDRAGQKGTGRWTVIEAQHLGTPVSAIEAAVAARNISARTKEREAGEALFGPAPQALDAETVTPQCLENALLAGKVACYAQGFTMIEAASEEFGWSLPLPEIAKVWRAGCIIRSTMLNDMAEALTASGRVNLMFAPFFADIMKRGQGDLRSLVSKASLGGNPVPALSSGLAYFDMMRTGRSTANMIQAQRDFFGAHSFERVDAEGAHHGPWVGS